VIWLDDASVSVSIGLGFTTGRDVRVHSRRRDTNEVQTSLGGATVVMPISLQVKLQIKQND
jgi:hypothetical protein